LRGIHESLSSGINLAGKENKSTLFTPLAPFTWIVNNIDRALTKATWKTADTYISRGVDYLKQHPEALEDPDLKLDAKTMGLRGNDADSFNKFTADMEAWNMHYPDLVRSAIERGDGTLTTDADARKLYAMTMANISSESSVATMPVAAYNNSMIRLIAPLLSWGFRRGMMVADLGKNAEGRYSVQSVANSLAGLGILIGGGLGVSAAVNAYSDDILGKKRNLRPIVGATPRDTILGIFENLNRAGSFGLLGEGLNGLVNVGTGADNRIIDANQRIVALSALGNIQSAISAMVNQKEADYAHVVRPLLTSFGGNGTLQYIQIANKALGLDNLESRVVARANAQNWLRTVGRDMQLDVRESGGSSGGYANLTPVSPALTRMEYAAYGNNPSDFREAYNEAIQAAKELGNPDPVDYVKRAYAARNPLRSVFKTAPSELEYRQILSNLPDDGREDVQQAVNYFNHYAESIGARPFDGKAEKPSKADKPLRFTSAPQMKRAAMAY